MKKIFILIICCFLNNALSSQTLIKNIAPGLTSSTPYCYYKFDNTRTVFFATDGFNADCLFITDGTNLGTYNLAILNRSSYINGGNNEYKFGNQTGFTKIDSLGYLIAPATSTNTTIPALIRTNGSISGTSSYSFTLPSPQVASTACTRFFKLSNKICWVYFYNSNSYLYSYDLFTNSISYVTFETGVPNGYQMIYSQKNYNSGTENTAPYNQQYIDEVLTNDTSFFCFNQDWSSGLDSLFKIDINGNKQLILITTIQGLFSTPQRGVLINNKFLFTPDINCVLSTGNEPYYFDISNFNLGLLKDINPYFNYSSNVEFLPPPLNPAGVNHYIYFTALHSDYGREAWITDGTLLGTNIVKDLVVGPSDGIASLPSYKSFYHGDSLITVSGGIYWGDTVRLITLNDIINYPSLAPTLNSGNVCTYSWSKGSQTYILDMEGFIYNLGYSQIPIDTLKELSCGYTALSQYYSSMTINNCLFFTQNDCNYTGYEPFKYCNSNILSVKENINADKNITIYPNPTNNQFIIDANTTDKLTVDLYDVNGRQVLSTNITGKTNINVADLNEGVYTLSIKTATGVLNKKLVVVR